MQTRHQGTFWKLLSNPAFEVLAAIVVVLIAAWIVIDTDVLQVPVPFGRK